MKIREKLKGTKKKVTRTVGKGISDVINYKKNRKTKAVGKSVDRHLARTADAKKLIAKHKRATKSFGGSGKASDWSPLSPKAFYAKKTINKSTNKMKSEVDRVNREKTIKKYFK